MKIKVQAGRQSIHEINFQDSDTYTMLKNVLGLTFPFEFMDWSDKEKKIYHGTNSDTELNAFDNAIYYAGKAVSGLEATAKQEGRLDVLDEVEFEEMDGTNVGVYSSVLVALMAYNEGKIRKEEQPADMLKLEGNRVVIHSNEIKNPGKKISLIYNDEERLNNKEFVKVSGGEQAKQYFETLKRVAEAAYSEGRVNTGCATLIAPAVNELR
jgi:hypothetical protein